MEQSRRVSDKQSQLTRRDFSTAFVAQRESLAELKVDEESWKIIHSEAM